MRSHVLTSAPAWTSASTALSEPCIAASASAGEPVCCSTSLDATPVNVLMGLCASPVASYTWTGRLSVRKQSHGDTST